MYQEILDGKEGEPIGNQTTRRKKKNGKNSYHNDRGVYNVKKKYELSSDTNTDQEESSDKWLSLNYRHASQPIEDTPSLSYVR
jgi:hypothetical protein